MRNSTERLWALTGPAFGVIFFVAVFTLSGSTPGEKATAEEVVRYYSAHQGRTLADAFLAPLLVTLLLLFVAYLRTQARLREGSITSRLAPTVLVAGAAVWASGALLGSVGDLALVSVAHHKQFAVAQTVNVLSNSMWIPFIAGLAATLIGAGLTALSSRVLPGWMGWVALVAGIVSLIGPGGFAGFFVAPLWIIVAGALLFRRREVSVPTMRQSDESAAAVDERTTVHG